MADYIKELRKVVGSRSVILCGAGVIIVNGKGEVLLLCRGDNNKWACPAGAVELGESVEEAAIHETFEETGLKVKNLKLFGVYSGKDGYCKYPNGDEAYWVSVAFTTSDYKGEIHVDHYGSKECSFFNIDELPENINLVDRLILNDYIKGLDRMKT